MPGAKKNKAMSRRREQLRRHRRPRLSARRVVSYAGENVGDRLYMLGCLIERYWKNFWRQLWKSARRFFARLFSAVGRAAVAVGDTCAVIWRDVTAPFVKAARSLRSLRLLIKATKPRGRKFVRQRIRQFFRYGWRWNKHLIGRLMNYLVPVAALTICLLVVLNMANLNYALRVSYNGQTVGFIEDEYVYDSARKIIQNRLIAADEDPIWDDDTVLSISVVGSDELQTQDLMAESLLAASGTRYAQATGVYIGGKLYGATTAPEMLEDRLTELQEPYQAVAEALGEDTVVKFARDVERVDGIYPASSILSYEELIETIATEDPQDVYYTYRDGDSIEQIALQNGITVDRLRELNPSVTDFAALEPGSELLVAVEEPLLRVKTVQHVVSIEPIAYETITTRNSNYDMTYARITQYGENGERTITKEIEYDIDGEPVLEIIVEDLVTKPAVSQEVTIGTRNTGTSTGRAIMSWPVGGADYSISRGWIEGLNPHFGIDIAAPYGTPIYAAESGVVTLAQYGAYSYGNYVIITHDNGISTVYAHCSSLVVTSGTYVQRGSVIALVGSTGNSTGNHLHFEVRINGIRVPPESWIY